MRVMLSCPYSLTLFGGVQGQVLGLARALRDRGVDARIVAPCDGPPPEPGITTVGPSSRVPSNGSVAPIATGRAVARRTIEALRTFRPDVLHLHEPLSPGPNHAALVGTTIPAVGTFHSARSGRNGWYETFRPGLKPMMRRLAVSTAVSDDAMRQVTLTFGGGCEILPNGVDVPSLADGPATPSVRPAIVFVGRHEQRKGLAVLLDAFAGLERDADLWVIGDGPEGSVLRARGVPRVHWLGRVTEDEKQARLRGATIACFPAVEGESFGVVLLEAMAARTALVASDIDGYRTVSRADREALLVPPGDVSRLRGALRALLDDPARRAALVAEGARRADEFSMEHLAERFLPLYERAIGADRSPIARTARSVPGGETGGAGSRR
jgi:phosphatidylinositol alpha-mannosyltransferase